MNKHFFPKKTPKWLTDTWKDAQHHSSLGNYNSKLWWVTTSYLSELLKLIAHETADVGGCREWGTLLNCSCECKLVQPLWKTVWSFLKNFQIELSYNPAIAPLLSTQRIQKIQILKGRCTPIFRVALWTTVKLWKEPTRPLTDEWIKKRCLIHIHSGILLSIKNQILPFPMTWTKLECIILSKISQRKTKTIWIHSYVEFKKQLNIH